MSSGRLLMMMLVRVDVARFGETFSIKSSSWLGAASMSMVMASHLMTKVQAWKLAFVNLGKVGIWLR